VSVVFRGPLVQYFHVPFIYPCNKLSVSVVCCKAESRLNGQEIPRLTYKTKIYYRVYDRPLFDPILSDFIPVHPPQPHTSKTHFIFLQDNANLYFNRHREFLPGGIEAGALS
jgi:hypothetical protein